MDWIDGDSVLVVEGDVEVAPTEGFETGSVAVDTDSWLGVTTGSFSALRIPQQ